MHDWTPKDARLAKALFGRAVRVQVAEWVLERRGKAFFLSECQTALSRQPGAAASAVRAELENFVELGLLGRFESERRVYFTQVEHSAWSAFEAIAAAITDPAPRATLSGPRSSCGRDV